MADWTGGFKRIGAAVATGGLSEAYKQVYGGPADAQKAGYDAAGNQSAQLGVNQRDYETRQGNAALGFYGQAQAPSGPRPTGPGANLHWRSNESAAEAWDKQKGAYDTAQNGPISPDQALMNMTNNRPTQQQDYFDFMGKQAGGKTNQETLFDQRKNGGVDPAAAYEDKRATEGINTQLAARGRYNSGAGVRQISDYLANTNAQRSHDLANLAGGADNSRLGLDTAYGSAAKGASGEERGYFNDVMDSSKGLADAKADTFGHYSDRGSDQYSEGQKAKIEAMLTKAGVDAATIRAMFQDAGAVAEVATKAGGKK